jgi:hypothetical protein
MNRPHLECPIVGASIMRPDLIHPTTIFVFAAYGSYVVESTPNKISANYFGDRSSNPTDLERKITMATKALEHVQTCLIQNALDRDSTLGMLKIMLHNLK